MSIDDARIGLAQVAVGDWMRTLGAGPVVASSIAIDIAALARAVAREEFAKLSPAPVGGDDEAREARRAGKEAAERICARVYGDPNRRPTPPAATSDGDATASWDNSLAEANEKIASLEAQLAEAKTAIENLNVEVAEYQRCDRALYAEYAAEACRERDEALKRVADLEASEGRDG